MNGSVDAARLLLVEDNEDEVFLARTAVKRLGRELIVETASNGPSAISILSATGAPPDLTLLDINLPLLGGLEVLRQVRRLGADPRPVIVVMTTSSNPADERAARELGCDDFVVKPVGFADYLEVLRGLIDRWVPSRV